MLPRYARLTSPNDFARTTKSGFRVSSKFLVVYLNPTTMNMPPKAGLIISKNVGGSVARHKVARQIRHSLKDNLKILPTGTYIVVRALTGSHGQDLNKDLNFLILKILEKSAVLK